MNLGISSTNVTAQYLRTLPAIRERAARVHELAKRGELQFFDYHPDRELDVVDFCANIIQVVHPLCDLQLD